MRVVFDNHRDFLKEIAVEHARVRNGVVRARVDRVPDQPEQITFQVWLQLSAVIEDESGGYLVEFSGKAGNDDEETPTAGSDRAAQWSHDVVQVVQDRSLELRPGKIEFV